jgi:hypothetical protein
VIDDERGDRKTRQQISRAMRRPSSTFRFPAIGVEISTEG